MSGEQQDPDLNDLHFLKSQAKFAQFKALSSVVCKTAILRVLVRPGIRRPTFRAE